MKFWALALSITFMAALGLFFQTGDLGIHVVLLIAATTLLASIVVGAPLEYQKLKQRK